MRPPIKAALILGLVVYPLVAVPADDPPAVDPKTETARSTVAVELAKKEAVHYRLEMEGGSKTPVVLHPDSLLQWSSPVVGSIHGSVFVWTDRGCPVAVASIYKWFSPNTHLGIELHALTPDVVSADRKGRRVWSPGKFAVERKPIPAAPVPADSVAGRLRQLRTLAKEFSASETTRANITRELRLLTQPIYRYQSTNLDVIDGALFTFVEGTDPEIFLMIEARRTASGSEWQFAAVRMNSLTLKLSHKGHEVWTVPTITWAQAGNHNQPYTLFTYGSDPGSTPDDPGE
jgi:hypothetical protein